MILVSSDEFKRIQKVLDKKHLENDKFGDKTWTKNVKKSKSSKRYAIREDKYEMYLTFMHKHYKITNEKGERVNGLGKTLNSKPYKKFEQKRADKK